MMLNKLAINMEKFFTQHNTYKGATLNTLGFTENIADNHYRLLISSALPNEFTIKAIPINEQLKKDSVCGILTLNSVGEKTITGSGALHECW